MVPRIGCATPKDPGLIRYDDCIIFNRNILKACVIRMLFDSAVAVEDKEIHVFEGAAHQLYLERREVREDAVRRTVEWVMKRATDSYYRHSNGEG